MTVELLPLAARPMLSVDLHPVGVVRSPMCHSADMPPEGVPARIEVFPEYTPGLFHVEHNSHITVLGWLDRAARDVLEASRPNGIGHPRRRGVFACRCQARPNPIGVTATRLLRIDGNMLFVEHLDMIDGTPVLDIKPYTASFDSVFSARSSRDVSSKRDHYLERDYQIMLREAASFHGEACRGAALGVRMVSHMRTVFGVAQKDPGVAVLLGSDGCVSDALQGLCGATFGNGRLLAQGGDGFRFQYQAQELAFCAQAALRANPQEILAQDLSNLFIIGEKSRGTR